MKTAKIVIGANFGDEGKGLMTDYFANEAKRLNKSCLVICHNGGSQRGHTVVTPNGVRHVFHHFGSGCFEGADTYLSSEYILNPIIFNKELLELKRKGINTKCFVNEKCRITTPFDMIINQIAEEYRASDKHGSCGLGIYETIKRNEKEDFSILLSDFCRKSIPYTVDKLFKIALEYLPERLNELGVLSIPVKWIDILSKREQIIENYINDLLSMISYIDVTDDEITSEYDYLIFEGAQGLLLDQNNVLYMPHLTPSNTGIQNPLDIIGDNDFDIEVCYVSRTYMTRHGAGRFDTECKKSDINSKIIDLTNVPNPYQDSIRYGTLNLDDLNRRICDDMRGKDIKCSLAITHWNEYETDMKLLQIIFNEFDIYVSDGMTRGEVCKYRP